MTELLLHISVIVLALFQTPTTPTIQVVTDREAYTVYEAALGPRGTVLLQQETEGPQLGCAAGFLSKRPADWQEAVRDFTEKNRRSWLLQDARFSSVDARFISRASIQADDARLRKEYGVSNGRLPEQIDYTAVSAVGFDSTRTKAIVYVRSRFPYSDALMALALRNGTWEVEPDACVGVA